MRRPHFAEKWWRRWLPEQQPVHTVNTLGGAMSNTRSIVNGDGLVIDVIDLDLFLDLISGSDEDF